MHDMHDMQTYQVAAFWMCSSGGEVCADGIVSSGSSLAMK